MIKGNFYYNSEEEDYDEYDENNEGDDYYDQENYGEEWSDEDYVPTGPNISNYPIDPSKLKNSSKATIHKKKVSNFEKRLLTLFTFLKGKILDFIGPKAARNLMLSCKLIKENAGKTIWDIMCYKHYNISKEHLKDHPEGYSYYLFYFLKRKKPAYCLLYDQSFEFKKPSKKLVEGRRYYSGLFAHLYDQTDVSLSSNYDINFVTKSYSISYESEGYIFWEVSYDWKVKQILRIIMPPLQSMVSIDYLPNKVIQFRTKDHTNPDKYSFYYVPFTRFFEPFKKNTINLAELSLSKVFVLLDEENSQYYTNLQDCKNNFSVNLAKNNELLVKYKEFSINFTDVFTLENQALLCLIDRKLPIILFIDYTKPKLVKVLPLLEMEKIREFVYVKEKNTLKLQDIRDSILDISITNSKDQYSFKKELKHKH